MTRLIRPALLALAVLGAGAAANADTDFKAKFSYVPGDSVEKIYTDFDHTAAETCRHFAMRMGPVSVKQRAEAISQCRRTLLDRVVRRSGMSDLIALHERAIGESGEQKFAGR